jgi:hypothetical protein
MSSRGSRSWTEAILLLKETGVDFCHKLIMVIAVSIDIMLLCEASKVADMESFIYS